MPHIQAVPGQTAPRNSAVHTAIARASSATGVNFDYLMAQAKLESGLDPQARASTSSAAGLYQFVSGTWLETMDRHGAQHGLGWAGDAITRQGGRAVVANPHLRAEVMALRYDPDAASLMAAELARDNAADLRGFLGREPEHAELYLAHFLGSGGAREFLGALQANPQQSANALFPKPASANRAIFFDGARARSLAEVMDLFSAKMANAMGGSAGFPAAGYAQGYAGGLGAPSGWGPPVTGSGFPRQAEAAPVQAQRPSMAETLRSTFGSGSMSGGSLALNAGQRVDAAYAKFRTFGL